MPGKGAAEEALIEHHGVGDAEVCERLNAPEAMPRVCLVKPVQQAGRIGCSVGEQAAGCRDHGPYPPLGDTSARPKGPHRIEADVSVKRARCTLRHVHIGVLGRNIGPFWRGEAEHGAKHDEGDWRGADQGEDRVWLQHPEVTGLALERLITLLEGRIFDEALALR